MLKGRVGKQNREKEIHKQTERFFLEGEEDRVKELEILKIIIDHVVELQSLRHTSTSSHAGDNRTHRCP